MPEESSPPPAAKANVRALAPTPAAPPPPPAATKSVEAWAESKGLLVLKDDGSVDYLRRCPWEFMAARSHFAWGIGRELSEAEFDAAITTVTSLTQG